MAISNSYLLEVHTANRLSWFFIALSGLALAGIAYAALVERERSLIAVALSFAVGPAVGIHTRLHPRTLLKLHKSEITLFPGTLWSNPALITIPREHILSLSAEEEFGVEGPYWILRLTMTTPLTLSGMAAKWASTAKRSSSFRDDPESVLIWALPLPHLPPAKMNAFFAKWLDGECDQNLCDVILKPQGSK